MHPLQHNKHDVVTCTADVIDKREVTDSGGHTEERFVIMTELVIAGESWPIEITLTEREKYAVSHAARPQCVTQTFVVKPGTFICHHQEKRTTTMKIAILSRKSSLYSTHRLVEAAEARGHSADVVDTLRCYMNISSSSPNVHYKGNVLKTYDAVIPRIGASVTFYGAAVIRQLEMMVCFA